MFHRLPKITIWASLRGVIAVRENQLQYGPSPHHFLLSFPMNLYYTVISLCPGDLRFLHIRVFHIDLC